MLSGYVILVIQVISRWVGLPGGLQMLSEVCNNTDVTRLILMLVGVCNNSDVTMVTLMLSGVCYQGGATRIN